MKRWAGIARFGGIGDNLVAGAPLYMLKKLGYMTEMITAEPNHVVFINNPWIDKLSAHIPDKDLPQGDMLAWQKWFAGRARTFDIFAHLSHSMEGKHAVFEHMTSFWWSDDERRKICKGSYLETACDLAGGVPYEFDRLFYPTEEELGRAYRTREKIGGRFVAWCLSGSRIDKVYPYTAMVICRILKELKVPVITFGAGEKERSMAMAIQEHVKLQNSSLEGLHQALSNDGVPRGDDHHWDLRRSLTMCGIADLYVGPDTGPSWAVSLDPIPKIIMVSHASAENITKHWRNTVTLHADQNRVPCWPCHRLHNTPDTCVSNAQNNGAKCISDISVDVLFEQVKAALARPAADNVVPLRVAS